MNQEKLIKKLREKNELFGFFTKGDEVDQIISEMEVEVQRANWSREKELALLSCIIIQEGIVSGTLFQTFDKVFEIADAFIQKYGVDGIEWGVEVEYDEVVIEFAKSYIQG
jgi:hypothetical protein